MQQCFRLILICSLLMHYSCATNQKRNLSVSQLVQKKFRQTSQEELFSSVRQASVTLLGEVHQSQTTVEVLDLILSSKKLKEFIVAWEFIPYSLTKEFQTALKYPSHVSIFKKRVGMTESEWLHYWPVMQQLHEKGVIQVGINAPRSLVHLVALKGLEALTSDQKKIFGPEWHASSDEYFEFFKATMKSQGHHQSFHRDHLFAAQLSWDNTMAWRLSELAARETVPIIAVVGKFHVHPNGGIPYQLRKRATRKLNIIIAGEKLPPQTWKEASSDNSSSRLFWIY